MNKITLLDMLKTEPFSFTPREIEEILDEELNKSPDDMDTGLIDICVDVLEKAYSEENGGSKAKNQKIKKFKGGKVLLVAAIAVLVLSLSFSASAKFLNIDASEKIVQFINNRFNINLGNGNTVADSYSGNGIELINSLNKMGFENIILPAALISEDYSVQITTRRLENIDKSTVKFKNNTSDLSGTVSIMKHTNIKNNFAIGQRAVLDGYDQVKQISVNNLNVLVFSDETNSYIYYIDKNVEYDISINCDFDSAVKIAESIK